MTDSNDVTHAMTPAPPGGAPKARKAADGPVGGFEKPTIPEIDLEDEIGRGGMGVVYRGRQPYLDRRVAVKILLTSAAPNAPQFVERFRREAKILANLSHPNIVACHQAGTTPGGDCYLAMEFIDGPNLRAWVDSNGPLAEAHALEVVRDTARALEHASASGIIHRDVKPENVLLQPVEESSGRMPRPGSAPAEGARRSESRFLFRAKLVDLGLARPEAAARDVRLTAEGTVMGTPSTMAPEQFDDPDAVDFRADIYGLGCVFYHILVGEPAFPEKTMSAIMFKKASGHVPDPREKRSELRPALAALVRDMLASSRENRPQSYGAIIERCEALLAEAAASGEGGTARYYKAPGPRAAGASHSGAQTLVDGRRTQGAPGAGGGAKVGAAVLVLALAAGGVYYGVTHRGAAGPGAGAKGVVRTTGSKTAFGPPSPLDAHDQIGNLEGWSERIGDATWATGDEADGFYGHGTGILPRAIGPGPWRVEGQIIPVEANDSGARVDLAGGGAIGFSIRNFGAKYTVTLERFEPDPASGETKHVPVAGLKPLSLEVAESELISFALTADPDGVTGEAKGQPIGTVALDPATVAGFSAYVKKGSVRFRDLVLRKPAP